MAFTFILPLHHWQHNTKLPELKICISFPLQWIYLSSRCCVEYPVIARGFDLKWWLKCAPITPFLQGDWFFANLVPIICGTALKSRHQDEVSTALYSKKILIKECCFWSLGQDFSADQVSLFWGMASLETWSNIPPRMKAVVWKAEADLDYRCQGKNFSCLM